MATDQGYPLLVLENPLLGEWEGNHWMEIHSEWYGHIANIESAHLDIQAVGYEWEILRMQQMHIVP